MTLYTFDKHEILFNLRRELDLPNAWVAFGINASDSIDRRIYVNKYQGRIDNHMSFYPTFVWPRAMVLESIKRSGVRLAGDYLLANRTLAAVPSYRHMMRMKDVFPDDYERVKLMFPMIEAELARQDFRRERYEAEKAALESFSP